MIFKELIITQQWDILKDKIQEIYSVNRRTIRRLGRVYQLLQNLEPIRSDDGMLLYINKIHEENGEIWDDVSGYLPDETLLYSIALEQWETWLGLEIHKKLWKITILLKCALIFYGK